MPLLKMLPNGDLYDLSTGRGGPPPVDKQPGGAWSRPTDPPGEAQTPHDRLRLRTTRRPTGGDRIRLRHDLGRGLPGGRVRRPHLQRRIARTVGDMRLTV